MIINIEEFVDVAIAAIIKDDYRFSFKFKDPKEAYVVLSDEYIEELNKKGEGFAVSTHSNNIKKLKERT